MAEEAVSAAAACEVYIFMVLLLLVKYIFIYFN